jgi:hypothetical protein
MPDARIPTVGDLIEELKRFPLYTPVRIHDGNMTLHGVDVVRDVYGRIALYPKDEVLRRCRRASPRRGRIKD